MNETSINLALVWRLIRHRWAVFLALAVLGGGLGAALSTVLAPGYVSTAKVLLQGARSETEVPGEAQIATSLVVLDHAADDLKWGVTGSQLSSRVSAAITGANVLIITGAAPTPEAARQLADRVTAQYMEFATQIITDAANATSATTQKARTVIQQKINDANKRITEAQALPAITAQSPEGDQARAEMQHQQRIVGDATQQLQQIDTASENAALNETLKGANARVIQPATLPSGPGAPTLLHLVLGGIAALVLIGVLWYLIALRTDKRLRRAHDIAAAAGAPVLGVICADPALSATGSLLRRIFHDDRRWATRGLLVADDSRGRDARFQRLLRKLPASCRSILVVVPNDDELAMHALVDLALASAQGSRPVAFVTEDRALADRVTAAAEQHGVDPQLSAGPMPRPDASLALVVARVAADEPSLSDVELTDGALLLIGAGTRTAWQLAGVTGACVDVGQPVIGLVVVATEAAGKAAGKASTDTAAKPDAETTMVGSA